LDHAKQLHATLVTLSIGAMHSEQHMGDEIVMKNPHCILQILGLALGEIFFLRKMMFWSDQKKEQDLQFLIYNVPQEELCNVSQ
jgi:hypothetical protein